MAVSLQITGKQSSDKLQSEGRIGLEEAIEDYLGDDGQVDYGGSGSMGWDIEVNKVSEDGLEARLAGLAKFLREWGAPLDTIITVYPSGDDDDDDGDEAEEKDEGEDEAPPSPYVGLVIRVFPEPT